MNIDRTDNGALPAYTIPEADADLWTCGTIVTPERISDTRLFNMTSGADGREYLAARAAERLKTGSQASARGRVNWIKYLLGLSWCKPPSCYGQGWAEERLRAFRERHGEAEYVRCEALARRGALL